MRRRKPEPEMKVEFAARFPGIAENWPIQRTSKFIPQWWKDMPRLFEGDPIYAAGSMKICPAILDVLLSGWVMPLPCDVWFNSVSEFDYEWKVQDGGPEMFHHPASQAPGMPIPPGYAAPACKFTELWTARTPPGYSLRISSVPLEWDPPLEVFPAIVDTDYHHNLIPVYRYRWMGRGQQIIPAGTPLCLLTLVNRRDEALMEEEIIPASAGLHEEMALGAMRSVNWGTRLVRGTYKASGKKWKRENGVEF